MSSIPISVMKDFVTAVLHCQPNAKLIPNPRRMLPQYSNVSNILMGRISNIATDYGLDGPGIESRWDEISARPDRPWGPPSLLYSGYRVFPGGKVELGCAAHHSSPSSAAVMEE